MTSAERMNGVQVLLTNAATMVPVIRLFLAYEWLNSGTGMIQSILTDPDAYLGVLFSTVWAKTNPYSLIADLPTNTAVSNAPHS